MSDAAVGDQFPDHGVAEDLDRERESRRKEACPAYRVVPKYALRLEGVEVRPQWSAWLCVSASRSIATVQLQARRVPCPRHTLSFFSFPWRQTTYFPKEYHSTWLSLLGHRTFESISRRDHPPSCVFSDVSLPLLFFPGTFRRPRIVPIIC